MTEEIVEVVGQLGGRVGVVIDELRAAEGDFGREFNKAVSERESASAVELVDIGHGVMSILCLKIPSEVVSAWVDKTPPPERVLTHWSYPSRMPCARAVHSRPRP
eukprot:EC792989.1.p1 GENE.EC792989.1~~EC792989.1.p1  ORF type:complete len:105 (-),score=19.90 EC792989.1:82-396(-)